ncbi:MAG: glycosyltransferase [Candidatus Omnitrophota bacterium]
MQNKVSLIILTKNEAQVIAQTLESVFCQKTQFDFEVIVIDSGSQDGTQEIIGRYPVKLVNIAPEEFGHGKTRNLGARLAQGEYVVFLNADATPLNNVWLQCLLKDFLLDAKIVGVYSKSIPRETCNPLRAREIIFNAAYSPETKIKYIDDYKAYQVMDFKRKRILLAFETISCVIRRSVLLAYPFDDEINFGEDLEWSKRILEEGYKVVFEPASVITHSHDFYCSLKDTLKKFFDDTKLNRTLLDSTPKQPPRIKVTTICRILRNDYRFITQLPRNRWYKLRWKLYAPLVRAAQFIGMALGCNASRLPESYQAKFSLVVESKNDGYLNKP